MATIGLMDEKLGHLSVTGGCGGMALALDPEVNGVGATVLPSLTF